VATVAPVTGQGCSGAGHQQKCQSVNSKLFHNISPWCCVHGFYLTTRELNES
jgi:hypothetical protein